MSVSPQGLNVLKFKTNHNFPWKRGSAYILSTAFPQIFHWNFSDRDKPKARRFPRTRHSIVILNTNTNETYAIVIKALLIGVSSFAINNS